MFVLQAENDKVRQEILHVFDNSCLHFVPKPLQLLTAEYSLRRFEEFQSGDWIDVRRCPTQTQIELLGADPTEVTWHQGIVLEVNKNQIQVQIPKFLFAPPCWIERVSAPIEIAPWNTKSTLAQAPK